MPPWSRSYYTGVIHHAHPSVCFLYDFCHPFPDELVIPGLVDTVQRVCAVGPELPPGVGDRRWPDRWVPVALCTGRLAVTVGWSLFFDVCGFFVLSSAIRVVYTETPRVKLFSNRLTFNNRSKSSKFR